MTLIYDPIEALQKIQELIENVIWICRPDKDNCMSGDDILNYVQNDLEHELDNVLIMCDMVLFRDGLK